MSVNAITLLIFNHFKSSRINRFLLDLIVIYTSCSHALFSLNQTKSYHKYHWVTVIRKKVISCIMLSAPTLILVQFICLWIELNIFYWPNMLKKWDTSFKIVDCPSLIQTLNMHVYYTYCQRPTLQWLQK